MLYKEALYCDFKYCDDDIDNINNLFDYIMLIMLKYLEDISIQLIILEVLGDSKRPHLRSFLVFSFF